jgi:hypothetical protein
VEKIKNEEKNRLFYLDFSIFYPAVQPACDFVFQFVLAMLLIDSVHMWVQFCRQLL